MSIESEALPAGPAGPAAPTAPSAPETTVAPPAALPLRFTGNGAEYFGVWIVNLLLTVLTLGVYSAWAKVRRLKYFYRHTELDGTGFDFHGSAVRILVGRLIALAMVILYNVTLQIHTPWVLLVVVLLALGLPWLLRNSLRFRLYNSSWRGARFHFRGSLGGAYRVFLLNGVLTMLTLYLAAPFAHQRLKAYQHGNSWFGRSPLTFHASVGRFYLVYLAVMGTVVALGIAAALLGYDTLLSVIPQTGGGTRPDPLALLKFFGLVYGALLVMALFIGPLFQALISNLIWSSTRLGDHRIDCRLSPWKLMWIGASNVLLVIVTFGLFIPWATVRMMRYRLESISLHPAGDLQAFTAAGPEEVGAVGEETASLFDVDIAL